MENVVVFSIDHIEPWFRYLLPRHLSNTTLKHITALICKLDELVAFARKRPYLPVTRLHIEDIPHTILASVVDIRAIRGHHLRLDVVCSHIIRHNPFRRLCTHVYIFAYLPHPTDGFVPYRSKLQPYCTIICYVFTLQPYLTREIHS